MNMGTTVWVDPDTRVVVHDNGGPVVELGEVPATLHGLTLFFFDTPTFRQFVDACAAYLAENATTEGD